MAACPTCQIDNIDGSAFCDNCGAPLAAITTLPPAVSVAPVAAGVTCPSCGTSTLVGQAFCENCGTPLTGGSVRPQTAVPAVASRPRRLVVQPHQKEVMIPVQGEILVGRGDATSQHMPDVDLDAFDALQHGVGRRHARLLMQGGQMLLEDLDSVNGTRINKQRLTPGRPQPLHDGDEVHFGTLITTFHHS